MSAPVVNNSTLWNSAFSTTATSSPITTPALCHLEIFIAESSAIDTGVTDSYSNTFLPKTLTPAANSSFGQVVGVVYVCENGVGGTGHTFTVTWSSGSIITTNAAVAITGAPTSGGMDLQVGAGTNSGASTSVPVAQGSIATASELVLSFALGGDNAETITGTYTSVQNFVGAGFYPPFALTSLQTTTTGTYGDTFTGSVADEYASGTVSIKAASGGGGVTETLSGQSVSSSEGSAARALAYSPTGQAITSTHGTVSASVSHSLTGQTAIFTEGTITASTAANVTLTLSGQTGTFTQGVLSLNIGYSLTDGTPLTGQTATFSEGAPTEAIGYALTGQNIASAFGAIVPAISHGVGGQSLTLTEGAISASVEGNVTLSLSGQLSAFTQGALSAAVGMTITGRSATFTEGSLSGVLNSTLLAQTGALTEGIISAQTTGNVTRALSGQLLTLTPGTVSIFVTGAGLIMPNLVGRNLQDATAMLQAVGVLNPLTIGYFGIWPISAAWTPRKSQPSGVVTAQSLAAGTSTTVNAPITLAVTDYPMSVNYP